MQKKWLVFLRGWEDWCEIARISLKSGILAKELGFSFARMPDWVTQTPTSWCDGVLFVLLEVFLADAAGWACPVGREVFESGSGGYAFFRVSFCRIVDVSADDAYIFIHNLISFGDAFQHPGRMSCDLWFWITKKAITLDCLQCKCFVWVVREMPCFTDKCLSIRSSSGPASISL